MFRLSRNERSHWSGNGVHVEPESVFMIGRNMQQPSVSFHHGRPAAVIISTPGKLAASFGGVVSPGDGVAQGGVGVIGSWSSPESIS